MTPRERIFAEINSERAEQARLWSPEHDDALRPAEWVALITRHAGLGVDDGAGVDASRWRRQMARVAALSVAALESWDRQSSQGSLVRLAQAEAGRTGEPHLVVARHQSPVSKTWVGPYVVSAAAAQPEDRQHQVGVVGP